jgi:predicted Zn-dependent peptidase
MDYQVYTLPNGIRLLHNPSSSQISHACIIVNAGSRDEDADKSGIAHFIEHLLFKKTARRSTNQILNCLEIVGADLNAYTTKEYTCIHASFLNPYLNKALDLFEDILFHSVFPEDELEKEKGIVLDEIASYQDQPEDAINDDFEDLLFKGHSLGRNILGTTDSVKAFGRPDILDFIKTRHNTHEIVIGVFGNYDPKKISGTFTRYFQHIPENKTSHTRTPFDSYQPAYSSLKKSISQTHCITGNQAYDFHHPNKVGLLLLNNLLGGPGMSSRLNLELREKYGIAYTIESNYTPLSDTGIFSIYFGTDPEKTKQALKVIQRELKKLRQLPLGTVQLHQAKQKFIGQIALGEENHMGLIISMAKSLLDFNRADTLEEVYAKIHAVTSNQLLEIANDIFDPEKLTTLIFDAKE